MPSKLGFGDDRKSAGKVEYGSGVHYKSPVPMSIGAVAGQAATVGAMSKVAGEMKKEKNEEKE